MKFKISLFIFLFLIVCSVNSSERCVDGESCSVSLVHLLALPEKYDNKTVIVRAFLEINGSRSGLYLDREKQRLGLAEYGVEVALTVKQLIQYQPFNKKYVRLYGTFKDIDEGDAGLFAGRIYAVDEIHIIE